MFQILQQQQRFSEAEERTVRVLYSTALHCTVLYACIVLSLLFHEKKTILLFFWGTQRCAVQCSSGFHMCAAPLFSLRLRQIQSNPIQSIPHVGS